MIQFNVDKVLKYIYHNDNTTYKSRADFARRAKIPVNTIQDILAIHCNPRLENAYKIAKEMKCPIEDLLIITKY